ncbi:UDP-Gal:alpha-D-GlcNAc-diphosphoundecaprenol beta-1 3-galactosyltransferase [termite gut metagenome]|uniref:UDP-Gal:alpha-D-GlcNAc-diphosphoundecaprenol beta-1 3-galactosyltransferase n=1 Tax=termite gut metagenome TaxID=433724 RepID=A0A5J4RJY9_9ZZZZ
MELFSVLVSVYYNENPNYFKDALYSIWDGQEIKPSEILLVEDGPLPLQIEEIINEFVQHTPTKIIKFKKNMGMGTAFNEGLKYCSFELVARMDTDDIAKSDRFEKQIHVFQEYPDVDVVGTWIDEFEGNISNIISIRKLPEYHEEIFKFAKKRSPMNHPTVMFKKTAVIAAGGYKRFLLEDYYLWVRMLMNGAKFYNIQESLLFFRFSSDMFKRRGGWKYVIDEFKFQKTIRKIGFISSMDFIRNVSIRFMIRIVPNFLRIFLYKTLLRK